MHDAMGTSKGFVACLRTEFVIDEKRGPTLGFSIVSAECTNSQNHDKLSANWINGETSLPICSS